MDYESYDLEHSPNWEPDWKEKIFVELPNRWNEIVNRVNKDNETRLFEAVKCRDRSEIRSLISQGINVNHRNNKGKTALYYASYPTAMILLKSGAVCHEAGDWTYNVLYSRLIKRARIEQFKIYNEALIKVLSLKCIGPEVLEYIVELVLQTS